MTTTIWKFPLTITDEQIVEMPRSAIVLSVQDQNGVACIWAQVDLSMPSVPRVIRIFSTGNPAQGGLRYIGTIQQAQGTMVWHVFEDAKLTPSGESTKG